MKFLLLILTFVFSNMAFAEEVDIFNSVQTLECSVNDGSEEAYLTLERERTPEGVKLYLKYRYVGFVKWFTHYFEVKKAYYDKSSKSYVFEHTWGDETKVVEVFGDGRGQFIGGRLYRCKIAGSW